MKPRNEIERLLAAYADANFAAGEWTKDDDEDYETVSRRADEAKQALMDAIFDRGTFGRNPRTAMTDGEVLVDFCAGMLHELNANDHKTHWRNYTPAWLYNRLRQEVGELDRALVDGDPERVRSEAADVANFAMMIADKVAVDAVRGR